MRVMGKYGKVWESMGEYGSIVCGGRLVLRSLRRRRMPPCSAYAGSTVDGGLGRIGKAWEELGVIGKIAAPIMRGELLYSVLLAGAERLPAINSQNFSILPKTSQFYRAANPASLHYAAASRCLAFNCMWFTPTAVIIFKWLTLPPINLGETTLDNTEKSW